MNKIEINDRIIQYQVIQSKRKTYSICISQDGEILVRAPLSASSSQIKEIVRAKGPWILNRLNERKERKQKREFVEQELFPYLGENYSLKIHPIKKIERQIYIKEKELCIHTSESSKEAIQRSLYTWYRKQASDYIVKRVDFFSKELKEDYNRICIKDVKTRWGSCSSKGNLNFNWKLVMLPPEIIDYVVIHEICHLKELNHSQNFWYEVEKVLPNYKILRKWLRENGNNSCISFSIDI